MQVKVFEAADMASGLKLVRNELGPDALILSTKTIRSGKLGLLGKPTIEITAAIDSPWPEDDTTACSTSPQAAPKKPKKKSKKKQVSNYGSIDTTVGGDDISLNYGADDTDTQKDQEARQLLTGQPQSEEKSNPELHNEVEELKSLVHQLAGQIAGGAATEQQSSSGMVDTKNPVISLLNQHGIEGETASTIASFTYDKLTVPELYDKGKLRRFVIEAIENLIQVSPPSFDNTEQQKRIALIGPTGVGKTTTLAKLAANYLSNYSNSVALITIDTYRIAAVEQLKVYGDIMHLPVEVVISPDQLDESLARHADKSLILIDTAGRSPKDSLCIQELTSFLRPDLNIEKHLVLSAATRENELLDAIGHFEKVGVDKTIFTKVDECTRNGVILNIQVKNNSPLSYLTNGQRVPEDLLQITPRSVAELIMSHTEGIAHD